MEPGQLLLVDFQEWLERAGSYEQQAWCAVLGFSSLDAIVPTQSRNNEEQPAGHWPWGVQATFHVGCSQLSKGKLTKKRVRFRVLADRWAYKFNQKVTSHLNNQSQPYH